MCAAQDVGSGRAASALPKKGEKRMPGSPPKGAPAQARDGDAANEWYEVDTRGFGELVHVLT